jgi:hypothetical protein
VHPIPCALREWVAVVGVDALAEESGLSRDMIESLTSYTRTVRGVVVTRWSNDMFELDTHGRTSERIDEAAINIAAR